MVHASDPTLYHVSCLAEHVACMHGHIYAHVHGMRASYYCVQTLPELGCAWSSQTFTLNDKWLLDRVSFTARAVRLGINVLLCDTDIVIFSDPYA